MAKRKGISWQDVGDSWQGKRQDIVTRQYRHRDGVSAHGRSTVHIDCPFCDALVVAYRWSLRGGGKRCDCGAMIGSLGDAYQRADLVHTDAS